MMIQTQNKHTQQKIFGNIWENNTRQCTDLDISLASGLFHQEGLGQEANSASMMKTLTLLLCKTIWITLSSCAVERRCSKVYLGIWPVWVGQSSSNLRSVQEKKKKKREGFFCFFFDRICSPGVGCGML